MKPGSGRGRRSAPDADGAGRLALIHTNNSPKPITARAAAESYSVEGGDSRAVIEAAFAMAIKLAEGGYDKST